MFFTRRQQAKFEQQVEDLSNSLESERHNRQREQQESDQDRFYLKSQLEVARKTQNESDGNTAYLKSQLEQASKRQKESDIEIVTLVSELHDARESQQQSNVRRNISQTRPLSLTDRTTRGNFSGPFYQVENKSRVRQLTLFIWCLIYLMKAF